MDLAAKVFEAESKCTELTEKCEALQRELTSERRRVEEEAEERVAELTVITERQLYELDQERRKCEELANLYEKERREKDEALLRNAQVSQEIEMVKQELRNQQKEVDEIFRKNSSLDKKLSDKTQVLCSSSFFCLNLHK
jgi:golgin subfamily A protein 1